MTRPAGNRARTDAPAPIDAALLMDYWLGLLAPPDEDSVEEHLLACDTCGDRMRDVIALSDFAGTGPFGIAAGGGG